MNTADTPLPPKEKPGRLPYSFAKQHGVLIRTIAHDAAAVLHKPRLSPQILAEVRRFAGVPLQCQQICEERFDEVLTAIYQSDSADTMQIAEDLGDEMDLITLAASVPETEDLLEQEDDAPIIRLINAIFTQAIKENASDIHIETFEKRMVIRYRIDGVLREVLEPSRELAPLLVSRIKVMAKLDIAEKRIPQDGRISLKLAGREVDIRVSTLPASNGERVVLRLLDKQKGLLSLSNLGMAPHDLARMQHILSHPHGIILVTGPTGSGKTTSLYAALLELNDQSRNILTVEDPVEYSLEGVGQTQVNTKVEMTFARGLRAILRQDPDIVMVGEIRDLETAEIAIQASLTGHLVLSTLHTNSAVGAVTRLQDMGIEPFLLSSSLVGLIAQRLVRKLCNNCRESYTATEAECSFLEINPDDPPTLHRAIGCGQCNHTGYVGRMGIFEVVEIDEQMRTLIHSNSGEHELEAYAREQSQGIRGDGREKVLAGSTTIEEVISVYYGGI